MEVLQMAKKLSLLIILCMVLWLVGCSVRVIPDPEANPLFITWLIDQAHQRLQQEFPDEVFRGVYTAIGTAMRANGMESRMGKSVSDIWHWEFVFQLEGLSGVAFIRWNDGVWEDLEIVRRPWGGDHILLKADLDAIRYDLDQAIMMLSMSGFELENEWFSHVVFRRPLWPPMDEIMYIFTIAPGVYVSVGATTGKIIRISK